MTFVSYRRYYILLHHLLRPILARITIPIAIGEPAF